MSNKQRSFKKSAVDVNNAEKEKLGNDAARALESTYKNKIIELNEAKKEMFIMASKYAAEFDLDKIEKALILNAATAKLLPKVNNLVSFLSKFGGKEDNLDFGIYRDDFRDHDYLKNRKEICLQEIQNSFSLNETDLLLNDLRDLISSTHFLKFFEEYKIIYKGFFSELESLRSDINTDKFQVLKSSGVSYSKISAAIEYMEAVEKFLDIYDDVLKMDPRNEDEKSKGYKEYVTKILNDASQGIEDAATAVKDVFLGAASSIKSNFSPWFTKPEDKDFFADMPTIDQDKLDKNRLTKEAENYKSIADEVINEVEQEITSSDVSLPMADLSKAVKLTDALYSNAIHNNNQAEVRNIVETAKAECFETVAIMQKYVIQKCKGNNALATPEKCQDYNYKADLTMKNCATMFPMETNYDSVLNEHLQTAVSEAAVVSADGSITYVGAGSAVFHQPQFVPQLTAENVIDNVNKHNAQQMLAGSESILTSANSTDVALAA